MPSKEVKVFLGGGDSGCVSRRQSRRIWSLLLLQWHCQGGILTFEWRLHMRSMLLADTAAAGRFECRFRVDRNSRKPSRELTRRAEDAASFRLVAVDRLTFDW